MGGRTGGVTRHSHRASGQGGLGCWLVPVPNHTSDQGTGAHVKGVGGKLARGLLVPQCWRDFGERGVVLFCSRAAGGLRVRGVCTGTKTALPKPRAVAKPQTTITHSKIKREPTSATKTPHPLYKVFILCTGARNFPRNLVSR